MEFVFGITLIQFTSIVAGFGSILTASVLASQLYLNRKDIRIRQRPWLGTFREPDNRTALVFELKKIVIPFKNYGSLPAKETKYKVYSIESKKPDFDPSKFIQQDKRVLDIGPNEIFNCYVDVLPEFIEDEKLIGEFYFGLYVEYKDINKKPKKHVMHIQYKHRFIGLKSEIT
ncbi:MAG: hypothetical protein HRO68_03455 [Nitrosopumilus sp.]|nr:hypothetical protein [Nitrosopumilus sp.]